MAKPEPMTKRRALALSVMALEHVAHRYRGEAPQDWARAARVVRDLMRQADASDKGQTNGETRC